MREAEIANPESRAIGKQQIRVTRADLPDRQGYINE